MAKSHTRIKRTCFNSKVADTYIAKNFKTNEKVHFKTKITVNSFDPAGKGRLLEGLDDDLTFTKNRKVSVPSFVIV